MVKQSKANIEQRPNANTLTLQTQEIDTPILPVDAMIKFHEIRPDINDWIMKQTEKEGDDRRARQHKVDKYTFIERIIGQILGFSIGIFGVIGGSITAYNGYEWAGGTIATVSIGTLAVAFLKRQ